MRLLQRWELGKQRQGGTPRLFSMRLQLGAAVILACGMPLNWMGWGRGVMVAVAPICLTLSRRQLEKKNQRNFEKMALPELPPLLRYLAENSFIVVVRP